MAKCLLFEEGLFVLLVSDVLLHDILFYTFAFLVCFPPASRIEYIFGRRPTNCDCSSGALVFQLSQNLLVGWAVQRMVLGIVGCVIEGLVLGHVLVHVLGLDLNEKAFSVRVEELAALSVLRLELVL